MKYAEYAISMDMNYQISHTMKWKLLCLQISCLFLLSTFHAPISFKAVFQSGLTGMPTENLHICIFTNSTHFFHKHIFFTYLTYYRYFMQKKKDFRKCVNGCVHLDAYAYKTLRSPTGATLVLSLSALWQIVDIILSRRCRHVLIEYFSSL